MKKYINLLLLILTTSIANASPDSTKFDLYVGANFAYNSGFGVSSSNTGNRYTFNSKIRHTSYFGQFDNNFYAFILQDKLPAKTTRNYLIGNSIDGNKTKFIYPFVFGELEQNIIAQQYKAETGVNLRSTIGVGIGKKLNKFKVSYAVLGDWYNLTSNPINNPIYRHSFRTKYDNKIKLLEYGLEAIFQPCITDFKISRSKINAYVKYTVNKKFKLTIASDNFIDKYQGNPIERQLNFFTFGITYNH